MSDLPNQFSLMGSAVSIGQQNQVPDVLDRKLFHQVTGTAYNQKAYDCFVDDDGLISKGRFIEVISTSDVYLSHDWGLDESSRSTHDRVLKIGEYLTSRGLFVATDRGPDINNEIGKDTSKQIQDKITRSQCVIICMTSRYCSQVADPAYSLVREEFFTALNIKGPRFMLPVFMEDSAKAASNAVDVMYELFKPKYCVNCSTYENNYSVRYGLKRVKIWENSILEDLLDCILKTINPMKDGGSYVKQQFIRDNTVPGRHYTWLKTYLPQFDHTKCAKYSSLFTEAGVTTSSKLFHLVQCDDKYLIKLGVTVADAALIYKKLHDDLVGNMNVVTAVKIDAIIDDFNEKERKRIELILEEKARTDSIAVMHSESLLMSAEDKISFAMREEWRKSVIWNEFGEARMRLWQESMDQTNELKERIYKAQKVMFQQYCRSMDSQRKQEYIRISKITSGPLACAALRHLLLRVEREVNQMGLHPDGHSASGRGGKEELAFMMGRTVHRDKVDVVDFVVTTVKDANEDSLRKENIHMYLADVMRNLAVTMGEVSYQCITAVGETPSEKLALSKRLESLHGSEAMHVATQLDRVSSFVQPGKMVSDGITDENAGVDTGEDDYNGNAIFNYLQEGVILMKLIAVLSRDNPHSEENITSMVENSVVKLWTPLMNLMYHFDYTFDCSSQLGNQVDEHYHILSSPQEGLLALKFLMRYSPYRYSVNLRIVYLFGAANTIELCLEIVKFHFNNTTVVLLALECILILMDNVEYYREYAARLMRDRHNLMMLLMLLNKYTLSSDDGTSGATPIFKLKINAVLLSLFGIVIRTNQFNGLLLKFHCQGTISTALMLSIASAHELLIDSQTRSLPCEHIEIMIRMLGTVSSLFLDHSYVVSFNSTVDNKPTEDNIGILVVKNLAPQPIVFWLSDLLDYAIHFDNTLSQDIAFALSNVVYKKLEYKVECARYNVVDKLAEILHNSMNSYNNKENVGESYDTILRCLIALSNILEWQFDATNVIQFNDESFVHVRNGGTKKSYNVDGNDASRLISRTTVERGVCEVVMNIFREYSKNRSLVRAGLLLCGKLCFKGQYEACHRFATLGICEHILKIYREYKGDEELFFLFLILFTGLAESHPNLVGASKRLVSSGICGLLTEGLRSACKVTGARKWSHLNYPFTCRICLQTCQCVYSFVSDLSGAEALKKFTKCGFQGILLKPPDLECRSLDVDDILMKPRLESKDDPDRDECLPSELKTSLDIAMTILFEDGKFNGNIEYLGNVDPTSKVETMNVLFELFHIV